MKDRFILLLSGCALVCIWWVYTFILVVLLPIWVIIWVLLGINPLHPLFWVTDKIHNKSFKIINKW